jgi:hypothetical protein
MSKLIRYVGTVRPVDQRAFPVDMLRYDKCWPRDEHTSNKIISTIYEHSAASLGPESIHVEKVCERRNDPFNLERWRSFGWNITVIAESPA